MFIVFCLCLLLSEPVLYIFFLQGYKGMKLPHSPPSQNDNGLVPMFEAAICLLQQVYTVHVFTLNIGTS